MADETPEIGAGDVEIDLENTTIILRCSVGAMKKLSNMPGGIPGLMERCINWQYDTIELIILTGANLTANQAKTYKLDELIYKRGVTKLAPLCIRYLGNVMRGGKPKDDDEDAPGEGDDAAPLGEVGTGSP